MKNKIKGVKLPDDYIDGLMQRSGTEDTSKFDTARYIVTKWEEYKEAITANLADENDWDKMDYDKAHKWFIESSAGESGMHHSSLYNRARVGRNWVIRGYHKKHEDVCFGAVMELLRNAPEKDGMVDKLVLDKRLVWYYNEFDQYGKPPSTREIKRQYQKNGEKAEWEIYWSAIVRNSKKILELEDVPISKYKLAREIVEVEPTVSNVDVGCGGGKQK